MAKFETVMGDCTFRLTGKAPLLMHNERLANPMAPETRRLKALTGKRKKTDEDVVAISRAEFDGGLYIDDDGVFIPDHWVSACLRDAGKLVKLGTAVKQGVIITAPKFHIVLDKRLRTADELWNAGHYDQRMVGNQKARVLRTRPRFDTWSVTCTLMYDLSVFDLRQIDQLLQMGGQKIGIGDYRPRYGRFEAEVLA